MPNNKNESQPSPLPSPEGEGGYKKAFTLAEVLITLVVIGIIAAITVPTLMANHRKTEIPAKLKKAYSTFMNAFKLAEVDEGVKFYDFDIGSSSDVNFKKYLAKHLRYKEISGNEINELAEIYSGETPHYMLNNDGTPGGYYGILDDGTVFRFEAYDIYGDGILFNVDICVDVNGFKKPNQYGRDIFRVIQGAGGSSEYGPYKLSLPPKALHEGKENRDFSIYACRLGYEGCEALIYENGWKIPKDYPHRI